MSNDNKKVKNSEWLEVNLPKYERLKNSSQNVLENLLTHNGIDYLSISGRVKDKKSCLEKVERKGYYSIKEQMTDLAGVRVIVYFESDLYKVVEIIKQTFNVDVANSEDKVDSLDKDKLGYRSVHYVCDLGDQRCSLPEFSGLNNLKFEVQVRTVLQHAWAELAHDRGYKFSRTLPLKLERKLNLYAGLLELADNGFDELSLEIDEYKRELDNKDNIDEVSIDSISLSSFISKWAKENDVILEGTQGVTHSVSLLVEELKSIGVSYIKELKNIIPEKYVKLYREGELEETNIFGMLRDWMIIYNHKDLLEKTDIDWVLDRASIENIEKLVGNDKACEIARDFDENDSYAE